MERTPLGFCFVALGGFFGTVARYMIDVLVGDVTGLSTFVVNVVGSFALGLLVARARSRRIQLFVGTGALSSFTTYSTFAGDTVALGTTVGAGYVVASYAVGFGAAFVGLRLGRRLP